MDVAKRTKFLFVITATYCFDWGVLVLVLVHPGECRTAADPAYAFETRGVDDRMLQNEPNFCLRFEGLTASTWKFRDSRRAPSSSTRTSADSAYAFETRKSRSGENWCDGRSHVEVAMGLIIGCCKTNPIFVRNYSNLLLRLGRLGLGLGTSSGVTNGGGPGVRLRNPRC